ncbi:MAG TPA: AlwI family type II restriction endonuclease, partial [Chloroflexota bacterium]|nr:AlwI family type II restriction endonuclease [Chloroflexota bacterium]
QLLKWQYPDFQHRGSRWPALEFAIHPFVATARLVLELGGLTREETALFCFTMRRTEDAAATAAQIQLHRQRRPRATGRVGRARTVRETLSAAQSRYAAAGLKVVASTNDYADALIRAFRYTGLFSVRGARLVPAHGREADLTELLYTRPHPAPSTDAASDALQLALGEAPPIRLAEPVPLFAAYEDHTAFHAYYGAADAPTLPWEEPERFAALARSLDAHVADLRAREAHLRSGRTILSGPTLPPDIDPAQLEERVEALRGERHRLERAIFALETRSPARLREALDYYTAIQRKEVIDPPTSLEWNTWRVFLALNAAREIVPNLQLDDDLQPLNPAPGNAPDMTVDYGDFLVVVEATLRGGADQRQAEARPVTRHVLEAQRRYRDPLLGGVDRPVYGLFLAPRIHPDTANDFFVALKYRVIEREQIAALPLTLAQLTAALRPFAGSVEFAPERLERLLTSLVTAALDAETGDEWLEGVDAALRTWLAGLGATVAHANPVARPVPLPLF